MFDSLFTHVSIISTSALSPGCNVVFANLFVTICPFSSLQSGLSSATNFSPCGISSLISVASPAISPLFVILIEYLNFTVTLFSLLFFKSTFTIDSGLSSALCPVGATVVCPVFCYYCLCYPFT